ncbi:MAG: hypothetical protein U1F57_02470 [bacterium]
MSRFPEGRGRDAQIAPYLPESSHHAESRYQVETMTADQLRSNISENLRDRAMASFASVRPPLSAQDAYDNLVSRGIVEPGHRPESGVTVAELRTAWRNHPEQRWVVRSIDGPTARRETADSLYARTTPSLTRDGVIADTRRHQYFESARREYTAWAQRPTSEGGLGLTASQAQDRFNQRAEQVGLLRRQPDGTYSMRNDWDPTSSDLNSPAQSFFHREDADHHTLPIEYNSDGTLITTGTAEHSNPASFRREEVSGTTATDPISRAYQQQLRTELSRDTAYAALTGTLPEGSRMRIERQERDGATHTFLVSPEGNRTEIRTMNPALTRDQALAYLQSRNLTDSDGRPLSTATPDSFMSEVQSIQSGSLNHDQAEYRIAAWERQQIGGILSTSPHNMNAQQITRYMQSHGWLGDHPNLDQMESSAAEPSRLGREAPRRPPSMTRSLRPTFRPMNRWMLPNEIVRVPFVTA